LLVVAEEWKKKYPMNIYADATDKKKQESFDELASKLDSIF